MLKSIGKQGKLNPDLESRIKAADNLTEVEDLYLPYKPKKKTRASVARENGLEPLARIILKQKEVMIHEKAGEFISEKVPTAEQALQGARDIVAEWINENKQARDHVRRHFAREAQLTARVVPSMESEGIKYKDYFDFSGALDKCPSHRILALFRGEKEKVLRLD
ncbi:unnamed protein product, partial [marine sediment metagenome]